MCLQKIGSEWKKKKQAALTLPYRRQKKIQKHSHEKAYSPSVLDITGKAELSTRMETQQPMICK